MGRMEVSFNNFFLLCLKLQSKHKNNRITQNFVHTSCLFKAIKGNPTLIEIQIKRRL